MYILYGLWTAYTYKPPTNVAGHPRCKWHRITLVSVCNTATSSLLSPVVYNYWRLLRRPIHMYISVCLSQQVPCTPDSCRSYCPPGFYLNPSSCECECRTSCGYDEVLDDYTCQCQKKSQYPDVQCSSLHYISTCLNSEPLYGISCL